MAVYTRSVPNGVGTFDTEYITDAQLAIHGSTGKQLIPFTLNKSIVSRDKCVKCTPTVDGMVVERLCEFGANAGSDLYFIGNSNSSVKAGYEEFRVLSPGTYKAITNSTGKLNLYVVVWRNNSSMIICNTDDVSTFTVKDGDLFRIFLRPVTTIDQNNLPGTYKCIIEKDIYNEEWEIYSGGTPYTDKYTATLIEQTENSVALSIKNASAAEGENTELDVVVTDIFGVTKRSEVGKTFIGGGEQP